MTLFFAFALLHASYNFGALNGLTCPLGQIARYEERQL